MNGPTSRIKMLRKTVLAKTHIKADEPHLLWARPWIASAGEPWYIFRRGRACADVLRGLTPVIDEGELIVGKYCPRDLTDSERGEVRHWETHSSPAIPFAGGQSAHMAIDYDKLLRLGIRGVKDELHNYRSLLNLNNPDDLEKNAFYRACLFALDAVVNYSHRYAAHAKKLAAKENVPWLSSRCNPWTRP